ncbi:hypothetical protein [Streptomyces sp. NPDC057428]|uniref:hypothetical protein n=1 Tax=Streptomyces sp. NPDC057428 TaxID=3346129 RepID=UPI003686951B
MMWTWHNEIPEHLVVQGGPKTLARVDVTFNNPDAARGGGEFRFDWPVYSDWGIGLTVRESMNSRRVDWVSTGPGNSWGQEAYVDDLLYEIEPRKTYKPGSKHTQKWFEPIERPHLNNNCKLPTREGSRLTLDVPGWGGSDHVGASMDYQGTRQTLTLYQGADRLAQATYNTTVTAQAPRPDRQPYRLVLDADRDASVSPYSSATHTEWAFTSEANATDRPAVLPLIQLDYAIDTDASGKAGRGREDGCFRLPPAGCGRGGHHLLAHRGPLLRRRAHLAAGPPYTRRVLRPGRTARSPLRLASRHRAGQRP